MAKITDLKTDKRNTRKRDARAKRQLESSIKQFGAARSIVVDKDGVVRAGNGTVEAAMAAGITKVKLIKGKPDELVVVQREDLHGKQAAAYAIADNRTAELADWDADELLRQVEEHGIELPDIGFSEQEFNDILGESPEVVDVEPKIDKADELAKKWKTKLGQLWVIKGQRDHRLLCGDATDDDAVDRLMHGNEVDCVFTDPPYGVNIAEKNRMLNTFQNARRCLENIEDDSLSPKDLKDRLIPAFVNLMNRIMSDQCTLFVCAPQGGELGMMMMMMQEAGLPVRHLLIWKKNSPTFSMGRLDYDYQHEPILLTWLKRHKRPMRGPHKTSVWEIDKPRASPEHPTMKPVDLYANAYLNNSETGDNVADIYAGSGTAFVAAEQLNRRCYGMEISPKYCAVILERMADLGAKCELTKEKLTKSKAAV